MTESPEPPRSVLEVNFNLLEGQHRLLAKKYPTASDFFFFDFFKFLFIN